MLKSNLHKNEAERKFKIEINFPKMARMNIRASYWLMA